jgi:hypothetical protein
MSDYERVSEALKSGADPAMLCETCPWGRLCVKPPDMTSDDVERQVKAAQRKDESRPDGAGQFPMGALLTTLLYAGKDRNGELCPVFSLRLRSADGRALADGMRALMRGAS